MAGDRAGLWVRVSSGGQDEENQVPEVERYRDGRGYREIKRYVLHDKSASKGEQQSAQDEVIADVKAGIVKVLVCWHSSRLDRRELEYLLRFIRLVKEAGGRIESTQEGLLEGDNLNTIIAGYMNNQDSKKISANTRLAHNRIAGNRAFRGRDPFAYEITGPKYDKRLTVIKELRPIAEKIFIKVIDGESLADICTWLDSLECKVAKNTIYERRDGKVVLNAGGERVIKFARGDPTPWWPAMLMRLIRHPAYSGTYWVEHFDAETGDVKRYKHKCDPIVTLKIQHQAIRALTGREKRGPEGNPATRAMLKGIITCPHCDDSPMYRMTGRLAGGRAEYYRCYGRGAQRKGCGNMVKMDLVDGTVDKIIAGTFAIPVKIYVRFPGHDWSEEIQSVKDEISQLGAEDLDDDEYDRRLAELRTERDRLKALPAEDDVLKEVETDETYADAYEAETVPDRGEWLKLHGFTVQADKAAVTVSQRQGDGSAVSWTESLMTG